MINHKIVPKEEFKELMCNPQTVMLDRKRPCLRLDDVIYSCSNPPSPQDFIDDIEKILGPDK